MQIDKIHRLNQQKTFRAGKVRVFSDFDRTFLPASHNQFIKSNEKEFIEMIFNNFRSFKKFLNNTKDSLKFTITTGRTFGEFLEMAETAKKRGFEMPLPDTLIVKNGSDEHLKNGTDDDFYKNDLYPFKYEITNKEKEEHIKKLTGWDGVKVRNIIYEAFKSRNFRIYEGETEHGKNDYGTKSLFTEDRMPYNEFSREVWHVGFRKDGNLKMYIIHPKDSEFFDMRQTKYQEIKNEIEEKLKAENIKFKLTNENHTDGRIAYTYEPDLSELGEKHLTKFYDTSIALNNAIKNNDLIVVAGDGSNDFEMLNPGRYLKEYLSEKIYNKYGKEKILEALNDPEALTKMLDNDSELAQIFIKMPFRGIIVRQESGINDLMALDPFTKGKYKKIIIVDQGELQTGIKQSIKAYCEQNPKYKEKLNTSLKKEIENDTSIKPHNEDTENNDNNGKNGGDNDKDNSNSSSWKYILGSGILLGIGTGVYLGEKNKKNLE